MYPKIIWQGVANVRGYDKPMRVVQLSEGDAAVEWSESTDAMGQHSWREYENWYGTLVRDLMRMAIVDVCPRTNTQNKIALIKLVREATNLHTRQIIDGAYGAYAANLTTTSSLSLKDAKELVEKFLGER